MTQQVIHASPTPPAPATPAVLDTNVLLDLLVFADRRAEPLRRALDDGRLTWLVTAAMLEEFDTVLARALVARWGTTAAAVRAAARGWQASVDAPPAASPTAGLRCGDASDQKFVDLAVAHRVPWLLTHDRALLRLRRAAGRHGVAVLTPGTWAALTIGPGPAASRGP